jgi:hypothetical protein
LKFEKFRSIESANTAAETSAKQMILMRSLMGDSCEGVDYTDFLPYAYIEQANRSKLKLNKWQAQVILANLDGVELDIQTTIKKDIAYLLKISEAY